MKLFQILNVVVTLALVCVFFTFALAVGVGLLEIRLPNQAPPNGNQFGVGGKVKARLIVLRGQKPNMEFPIYEGPNVLARADEQAVDIDLFVQEAPDRTWASRQHAVITSENGNLFIEDLNSTNGTFVNQKRIRPPQKQKLLAGDIIQIGEVRLKVEL